MVRTALLGAALALGVAGAAHAAGAVARPALAGFGRGGIVTVGEGCGANRWRGPGGRCNPFRDGYGNRRGTVEECPPGMHFEFHGDGRCYFNR